ncbi:MAG: hypothetical protein D6730_18965 [Bacteroidetes bacterium]|nr:MAG: hypothetical protein D6730_18965 [Bacteroidota bacterium]
MKALLGYSPFFAAGICCIKITILLKKSAVILKLEVVDEKHYALIPSGELSVDELIHTGMNE